MKMSSSDLNDIPPPAAALCDDVKSVPLCWENQLHQITFRLTKTFGFSSDRNSLRFDASRKKCLTDCLVDCTAVFEIITIRMTIYAVLS